jgi:hypothetical protein
LTTSATPAVPMEPISGGATREAARSCNGSRITVGVLFGVAYPEPSCSGRTRTGPAGQLHRGEPRRPVRGHVLRLAEPWPAGSGHHRIQRSDRRRQRPSHRLVRLAAQIRHDDPAAGVATICPDAGRRLCVPAEPLGDPFFGIADDVSRPNRPRVIRRPL